MSQATAIEWTDLSWNPVHGCSKVSPGCAHCYAETLSLRYGHTRKPWTPANAAENVLLKPHKLREPLSGAATWQGLGAAAAAAGKTEGKLVFVNSTSDLFHEQVPFEFVDRVYDTMARCPQHTFQILTKRPERMRAFFTETEDTPEVFEEDRRLLRPPLPNVWLGVSIENRRYVDRADVLRDTPAAVRFVSAEPLLGPLISPRRVYWASGEAEWPDGYFGKELDLAGIDWLIVGGESGSRHRPMQIEWVRDLRGAAARYGTAFFFKQTGGRQPGDRLEDLPYGLRIREFPLQLTAAML